MSARPRVVVIDTQTANLASVLAGLRRAGAEPRCSADAIEVGEAAMLVLPGVGAFAAGMQRLAALGLADLLAERVEQGRPLLAVCLGLQLLCEASEESPGVAGSGCCPPRCGASRVGSTVLACWCPSSDGTGWIPRPAAR